MKEENPKMGQEERVSGSTFRVISLVMAITLVGKLLGLLRDRLLAVNYGTGMYANAFLTASRIPRVFFDILFASAIAASFIPVFSEVLKKQGKDEAGKFANNFITIIGLATLLLTAAGLIFRASLVEIFADGYDAETKMLCMDLIKIMLPTIIFTGIAYSFVGILQSVEEFNIPALISVISNLIVIAYYIFLNERFGIYGLSVAFLVGWFMQAAIQIPSLLKKGFRFRLNMSLKSRELNQVWTLMIPVMISTWVQPINLTINSRFASHLHGGSGVSAIEYSTNLYLIIIGVFILSVTNVIFPKLSRQNIDNDKSGFMDTVRVTMHGSMFFMIPMMCGAMALARPITDLIYGGGEFDSDDLDMTSAAFFFVTLGMIGYGIQNILSRVFFAKLDGKTPLLAGIISIAVNIILCMLLIEPMGVSGLAVSSAAATTVNAFVMVIVLEIRGEGYHSLRYMADLLKMGISAGVMTAAVVFSSKYIGEISAGKLTALFIPAIVGMIVYFLMTALMKLEEAKMITGIFAGSGKEKE